ncbi:hypothetical protein EVAR_103158_1 [Eumeta japonica]|uniref:Transposase n=1 Tax=Eumeta variegata TaxID=151549 RepID=A0A4C1YGK2_EUMVA|nr:hypothetical protein EVAR_103158_1 [Eumeta japonica]
MTARLSRLLDFFDFCNHLKNTTRVRPARRLRPRSAHRHGAGVVMRQRNRTALIIYLLSNGTVWRAAADEPRRPAAPPTGASPASVEVKEIVERVIARPHRGVLFSCTDKCMSAGRS